SGKLIEKSVHFFRGHNRRDALRQFWSGHKSRWIFLQHSFAYTIFKKRTQRRELSCDGSFLKTLVVQITDEFANHVVINCAQSGRFRFRRREESQKLVEVF